MAAASTSSWIKGFSGNPSGERLVAKSIIEMLDRVGDEVVLYPPGDESAQPMTRREIVARVLWNRAIDGDGTSTKLIIEYLDGKPGDAAAGGAEEALIHAEDMAAAEALLKEVLGIERADD